LKSSFVKLQHAIPIRLVTDPYLDMPIAYDN
jgi:hypothetical protein